MNSDLAHHFALPAAELPRLAARLLGAPLLIAPGPAAAIVSYLGARIGVAPIRTPSPPARAGRGGPADADEAPCSIANGVATIPVQGELVNRGSYLNSISGLTSYEALNAALAAAGQDSRVRGVMLDIDSPGGEAAGAMETAAAVRALSQKKPVVAYVNGMAASAAYAIAAGAPTIVAAPSATLGSIGVVWLHLDRSQALDGDGVKPTLIHAGAFKVDGNSLSPLDPRAGAVQAQIDDVYDLFTASVGRHRPALGQAGARKTNAAVYFGRRAVDAGLADRIGSIDDVMQTFARSEPPVVTTRAKAEATPARPPRAAASAEAPKIDAEKLGLGSSATLETSGGGAPRADVARITAIMGCDAARQRQKYARYLATNTDLPIEQALVALSLAGIEPEPHQPGARMARVPKPNIGPAPSSPLLSSQEAVDAAWGDIAGRLNREAGVKPK